eukprot:9070521-Alexandrium_andersonii.AAC.1
MCIRDRRSRLKSRSPACAPSCAGACVAPGLLPPGGGRCAPPSWRALGFVRGEASARCFYTAELDVRCV